VEELEDELENAEKTLELQQRHNVHGLLEAYEKRAQEIEDTQTRMVERQEAIEALSDKIAEFRQVWEPRLQILVNRVSHAFGEAFGSIGCAGEVTLRKGGGPDHETDDFETWSIEIKVKFRETEQLQALTGQTQSGGERSVSTIFYLLALQELAKSPFRVVDEINQGMDPRNERLVHSRLVDAACRPGTSQYAHITLSPFSSLFRFSYGRYFLITPKLLPGLKYHRNMKILTINNGKFIPGALDIAGIIEQTYQLQQD
jgi:structural maintenance of chromosomes protein 5